MHKEASLAAQQRESLPNNDTPTSCSSLNHPLNGISHGMKYFGANHLALLYTSSFLFSGYDEFTIKQYSYVFTLWLSYTRLSHIACGGYYAIPIQTIPIQTIPIQTIYNYTYILRFEALFLSFTELRPTLLISQHRPI